jgi:uncharacterized membrane protein
MEIELDKSFRERIFHAVIFEVTANIIIALSLVADERVGTPVWLAVRDIRAYRHGLEFCV